MDLMRQSSSGTKITLGIVIDTSIHFSFKKEKRIITFDDVITKVTSEEFAEANIPTFDLLIIDEAQDLSKHLWKFAQRLIDAANVSFVAGNMIRQ